MLQAAKRRDETLRRQFTHVQAQAFPGTPQERDDRRHLVSGRYGPAVVDRLLDELPVDGGDALGRDDIAGAQAKG